MTQQATLADQAGLTVLQIRRYEDGTSQPTLDAIRRLAIALGVSANMLVFDEEERSPSDALRYQFETVSRMSEHEQQMVRELREAVIVKNQVAGALERVNTCPSISSKWCANCLMPSSSRIRWRGLWSA